MGCPCNGQRLGFLPHSHDWPRQGAGCGILSPQALVVTAVLVAKTREDCLSHPSPGLLQIPCPKLDPVSKMLQVTIESAESSRPQTITLANITLGASRSAVDAPGNCSCSDPCQRALMPTCMFHKRTRH